MANAGLHIEIRGTVQGVGYRPWVYQLARRTGIGGRVWNHSQGVSIEAHGTGDALLRFVAALRTDAPPVARVNSVACADIPYDELATFAIDESIASSEPRVSIPADLATCEDCLRELSDPADRRYRYPFTNCTNCGPRYSIVLGAPYDRAQTSMAAFTMCAHCRREYESPLDRRFHAQPNACPVCGPHISAVSPRGQEIATPDPIRFAARTIRAGMIVALKGLGGFHLACDATSPRAVKRLRERKHRETKPFAVMVRDLAEAGTLAVLTDAEREQLLSTERPIVLAKSREQTNLANDLPLVGLFLPYTPLHHLLLQDTGVPLVMTSGNVADEPMVTTNEDALAQLGDIADVFLLHDREIVTRVDDSVVRVIAGAPVVLRRARGYVPRAIETTRTFAEPILACGAHLKNTFCIAAGNSAFLGPHIGDLESLATLRAYETAIRRMKEFVGASPRVVAHDLHPDYFSTRYALALGSPVYAASNDMHREIAPHPAFGHPLPTAMKPPWGEGHSRNELARMRIECPSPLVRGEGARRADEGLSSPKHGPKRPSRAQDDSIITIAVQHHHAHVVSVMAEHGLEGPVLGIAYDGTGFGTDGTSWGGEILIARYDDFERVATFRPIALAGGDQAIRQPWRAALALLDDAFNGEPPLQAIPLFRELPRTDIDAVRRMIARNFNTSQARGVGRYFDAIGALVLGMPVARYEGEVAFRWNMVAGEEERGRYPIVVRDGIAPWEIDPRPIVRGVVDDLLAGRSAATISGRFHNTLATATVEIARAALAVHGDMPVVLSGGCFQNARLTESILTALSPDIRTYINHDVPPGDGGIALGQAFVADARLRVGTAEQEVLACV